MKQLSSVPILPQRTESNFQMTSTMQKAEGELASFDRWGTVACLQQMPKMPMIEWTAVSKHKWIWQAQEYELWAAENFGGNLGGMDNEKGVFWQKVGKQKEYVRSGHSKRGGSGRRQDLICMAVTEGLCEEAIAIRVVWWAGWCDGQGGRVLKVPPRSESPSISSHKHAASWALIETQHSYWPGRKYRHSKGL